MSELLDRSARIVDTATFDPDFNPMGCEVHELADGVAMVDAFSHVLILDGGDGLALFDVSHAMFGDRVVEALRSWSTDRLDTIVYTHGHADHVGGAGALLADNAERGPTPSVVAHEAVPARFDRYHLTAGYNGVINARQFGGSVIGRTTGGPARTGSGPTIDDLAASWVEGFGVRPTTTYEDRLDIEIGDLAIELHHGRGETDDHTWAWVPDRRIALVGDFVIWMFPNAGNPQKVQRYPLEWAENLRRIAAAEPELMLPAHGLPLAGRDRIQNVLGDLATALEQVTHRTLERMNAGDSLDTVLAEVRVDDELMERPWLAPLYDEPEFVVRNVWRQYGGWYDGTPSRLKPPRDRAVAAEVSALAGGVDVLVARARALAADGDLPLACHLIDLAVEAGPDEAEAHAARRDVYSERRSRELSLMAKGIYGDAARRSKARLAELDGSGT
ncbi:hypothetical protein BH24ACT4_BH24ACT4_23980 [soil metagenome]